MGRGLISAGLEWRTSAELSLIWQRVGGTPQAQGASIEPRLTKTGEVNFVAT